MSALGMTATVLATQLVEAVLKDEAPEEGGFDLSAGLFGRNVSDWIRATAKELDARASRERAWKECAEHPPVDAAVVMDATRYRWLRTHFKFANDSTREIWFDGDTLVDEPSELDESIDVAITAQQQENKQ